MKTIFQASLAERGAENTPDYFHVKAVKARKRCLLSL